jgi:hypothetical protein
MSDTSVVHIGENSPEQVAFKMMQLIADAEGRETYGHGKHPVTREWVLQTYSQCLSVVHRGSGEKVAAQYKPESFASPHR